MPLLHPQQVTTCDRDAVVIECIEGDLVAASEAAGPKDRMCRAGTDTRKPVNLFTRRGGEGRREGRQHQRVEIRNHKKDGRLVLTPAHHLKQPVSFQAA